MLQLLVVRASFLKGDVVPARSSLASPNLAKLLLALIQLGFELSFA